jgi:hypothetical protein
MKTCLACLVLCFAAIGNLSSDPMAQARCKDTEIKRVKSPNGKLVAVIYNRSCSGGTGLYTYAEVEDPTQVILWPPDRHPEVCFLATLARGYHQMDVEWKDDKHIKVSSTDELERESDVSSQHFKCNDIKVEYDFKFAPPPLKEAPDQETVEAISTSIAQTEACFDGGAHPDRIDRLRSMMKERQHGDALEWLCTYLIQEHCPLSQNVLTLIQQAATKMRSTKMSCYRIEEQTQR